MSIIKGNRSLALKIFCVLTAVFWGLFLISAINFLVLKKTYPIKYKEQVIKYSEEYKLQPFLVLSVIKTESNFNLNAISNKGAVGLMQILPSTASFIAEKTGTNGYNLYSAKDNVRFGCFYLRYLIDKFEVIDTALCAYNAGEGNVRGWLNDQRYSKDGKNLYFIPFRETREYLEKIQKSFANYSKLYRKIVDN